MNRRALAGIVALLLSQAAAAAPSVTMGVGLVILPSPEQNMAQSKVTVNDEAGRSRDLNAAQRQKLLQEPAVVVTEAMLEADGVVRVHVRYELAD